MIRIKSLTKRLAIWVFPNDHAPPHFHIISPDTDVLIDLRTLEIIVGTYRKRDLLAALEWAASTENRALIETEWRRLNERDD